MPTVGDIRLSGNALMEAAGNFHLRQVERSVAGVFFFFFFNKFSKAWHACLKDMMTTLARKSCFPSYSDTDQLIFDGV